MVKSIVLSWLMLFLLSGCTHYSVSNSDLVLSPPLSRPQTESLKEMAIKIDADMDCHRTRIGGNQYEVKCSNESRLKKVVGFFKEKGVLARPPSDGEYAPEITIQRASMNGFLESVTGAFNILTLGLSPLYHYDEYIVTYKDPRKNIEVTESVKISSYQSWFSLFFTNPEGLTKSQLEYKAENNLIRSVLEKVRNNDGFTK